MEQWLNPQSLGALSALIGGIVGALISILKFRASTPIEKEAAELATTSAITSAGKAMVETAVLMNERLEDQLKRMHNDLEYERLKVNLWEQWYNNFWNNWQLEKKSLKAPAGPTYPNKESDKE